MTAAPEEIPARIPSLAAKFFAVSMASSLETSSKPSITSRSIMLGSKPAEIPWMRCFPFWPFEMNGASSGSTPMISTSLFTSFNARPTPVIVPPVPIPLM